MRSRFTNLEDVAFTGRLIISDAVQRCSVELDLSSSPSSPDKSTVQIIPAPLQGALSSPGLSCSQGCWQWVGGPGCVYWWVLGGLCHKTTLWCYRGLFERRWAGDVLQVNRSSPPPPYTRSSVVQRALPPPCLGSLRRAVPHLSSEARVSSQSPAADSHGTLAHISQDFRRAYPVGRWAEERTLFEFQVSFV